MPYTANYIALKCNFKFQFIFLNFTQNIDFEYTLETASYTEHPTSNVLKNIDYTFETASSTEYPQSNVLKHRLHVLQQKLPCTANDTAFEMTFFYGFLPYFCPEHILWTHIGNRLIKPSHPQAMFENIDYTFEPPHLPSTHKECPRNIEYNVFYCRKMHTPCIPQFFQESRWRKQTIYCMYR